MRGIDGYGDGYLSIPLVMFGSDLHRNDGLPKSLKRESTASQESKGGAQLCASSLYRQKDWLAV